MSKEQKVSKAYSLQKGEKYNPDLEYEGPKRKCSYKKSLPRVHPSRFQLTSTRKHHHERTPRQKKYIQVRRNFHYDYKEAVFLDQYLF